MTGNKGKEAVTKEDTDFLKEMVEKTNIKHLAANFFDSNKRISPEDSRKVGEMIDKYHRLKKEYGNFERKQQMKDLFRNIDRRNIHGDDVRGKLHELDKTTLGNFWSKAILKIENAFRGNGKKPDPTPTDQNVLHNKVKGPGKH